MVGLSGDQLAALYNEHGSLAKVCEITGMKSTQSVEAKIKRSGYELIKQYRLMSPAELKERWNKILKKGIN